MKLRHLSIASIIGCVVGLAALLGVAVASLERMQARQQEIADLLALRERMNDFSAASDSLLLFGADPGLWRAFVADAEALQQRLLAFAPEYADARRAARKIDEILDALAAAGIGPGSDVRPPASANTAGPLDLPLRARLIMNQVAGHGAALDTALAKALAARQRAIARESIRVAGGFAGAAALFGALCVVAFGLIHRRVGVPAGALARTIDRIRAGDTTARAEVAGSDELADLAAELNRLIDQQQTTTAQLRSKQHELEYRERMLAESQRIARTGSWRLHLADRALEWSAETYRIAGVSPDSFEPTQEAFLAMVHPDDRDRLLTSVEPAMSDAQRHDVEFRLVRPSGEIRHVHERAEPLLDSTGRPVAIDGTIQDVTDYRRFEERLNRYRHLVEVSEELYGITDASYHYVYVNQAYANWHERPRDEIEATYLPDILGEGHFRTDVKPRIDRCLAGEPQIFEFERDRPGQGRRHLLARYQPHDSPVDGSRQVAWLITDVTELKRAETELYEQARLLDIAGRVARLGGWSVDLAAGTVTWSGVVAEMHGMEPDYSPTIEEAVDFVAPEYRERLRERLAACTQRGEPYEEELQIVAADGSRVWARAVGEPVRDDTGTVTHVQGAVQDISQQKAADLEVERLYRHLTDVLESITDAFLTLDRDWRYTYANAEATRLLEKSREELYGRTIWQVFPAIAGTPFEQALRQSMDERVTTAVEEYYEPLAHWFEVRVYPTGDGLALYFRDVSERREMTERLRAQEAGLRESRDQLAAALSTRQALINALPAHIALLDGEGTILDVNDQWRHFGQENAHADASYGVGLNYLAICEAATGECEDDARRARDGLAAVLAGKRDTFALEYPCHSPQQQRWYRMMANRLHGGDEPAAAGAVVMHIDITERKLAEQELRRIAYQDALTGLPSRQGFALRVSEALERTGWQTGARVVMLNIRDQRDVNDAHGHAAGDVVLQEVARRLLAQAGEDAIVGRPAGDEFVVFLPERPEEPDSHRPQMLASVFNRPFDLERVSVDTSAHFGVTRLGHQERSPEELMREAAVALFQGRQSERRVDWNEYTPEIDQQRRDRVQMTRELQLALERDEFELHYQPKVTLADGRLIAAEALIRWRHPERGLQSPATFIPIAERSQLIGPIGDWTLREACRHLRAWQDAGLDIVRVAVNVSLVQFLVGDFASSVRDALDAYGVEPADLTLEITESVFGRESEELHRQIHTLHDLGVRLSLDDFGTGYSSLLYLQRYPFDEIKIDQGFVRHMLEDPYSHRIVKAVLGLSAALGAEPIAEGIENARVRDALVELGCRLGQGFHYSVPLPSDDFRWLLEQRGALPLASSGDA